MIASPNNPRELPVVPAEGTLGPPFFVDQGALQVEPNSADELRRAPDRTFLAVASAVGGGLHLSSEAVRLIERASPAIGDLSVSRRGELLGDLVSGPQPAARVDAALRTGMLQKIAPEIERLRSMPRGNGLYKDVYVHTLRVLDATADDLVLRLAALFHDVAKPETLAVEAGLARFPNHDLVGAERSVRRLKHLLFASETVEAVEKLVRLHLRANSYEPTWTDSAVRRLRLDAGDQWDRLLALSFADVTSARTEVVSRAHRRVGELRQHAASLDRETVASPLDGTALMERFKRGPGRWIGVVKDDLLARVQSGDLDPNDEAAAWRAAERVVAALEREEAAP